MRFYCQLLSLRSKITIELSGISAVTCGPVRLITPEWPVCFPVSVQSLERRIAACWWVLTARHEFPLTRSRNPSLGSWSLRPHRSPPKRPPTARGRPVPVRLNDGRQRRTSSDGALTDCRYRCNSLIDWLKTRFGEMYQSIFTFTSVAFCLFEWLDILIKLLIPVFPILSSFSVCVRFQVTKHLHESEFKTFYYKV